MATPIPNPPPGAQVRYDKLVRHLSFSAKAWVTEEAARLIASGRPPVEADLIAAVRRRFRANAGIQGTLSDSDVAALVFLVLMQSAKSAAEDLKSYAEKVRYYNQQKAQTSLVTQPAIASRPEWPPRTLTAAQTTAGGTKDAQDNLVPLGEVSLEKQRRLQMYMQSFTKTEMMISNLLKKVSETASAIVQNLK